MGKGYIDFILHDNEDTIVKAPSQLFKLAKQPEWFDDPFVKQLIEDIDGTKVLYQYALLDKNGKGIPPEYLSDGCKSVILMKYLPDRLYSNEFFGHNCWPHIAKLAESGSIIKIAPWEHIYCIEGYGIDLSIFLRIEGSPINDFIELLDATYSMVDDWYERNKHV